MGRKPPGKKRKQFVKRKNPLYKPKKPISLGTEVYQFRLATQSTTVPALAASEANGPKNSKILLPAGFSQHTTCVDSSGATYTVQGHFLKPCFDWTSKLRISFHNIAHHSDNQGGLNLRLSWCCPHVGE